MSSSTWRPERPSSSTSARPPGESDRQAEINDLLVDHGRSGRRVVRLKGGDPFVFGRGGEEAEALLRAGVDFEVVPGVSSAFAAPAAAGIPVTHRAVVASVTVVTGHVGDPSLPAASTGRRSARLDGHPGDPDGHGRARTPSPAG